MSYRRANEHFSPLLSWNAIMSKSTSESWSCSRPPTPPPQVSEVLFTKAWSIILVNCPFVAKIIHTKEAFGGFSTLYIISLSINLSSIYIYKAKSSYVCLCVCVCVCVCRSACQAMAAPAAAPIVTKLGRQTLNITSLKLIPPHLTFEAVLRPKLRSKVPHYHIT